MHAILADPQILEDALGGISFAEVHRAKACISANINETRFWISICEFSGDDDARATRCRRTPRSGEFGVEASAQDDDAGRIPRIWVPGGKAGLKGEQQKCPKRRNAAYQKRRDATSKQPSAHAPTF